MVKRIRDETSVTIFVVFGVFVILIGLLAAGLDLIRGNLIPFIAIGAVLVGVSEIGYNNLKSGKKIIALGPMRWVSLLVYAFVFLNSLALIFGYEIPLASEFYSSTIMATGFFILFEAYLPNK